MFVAGNFVLALAGLLHYVLTAYTIIIIARAVLSFVDPDPRNQIVRVVYRMTEPVLALVRRRLPTSQMGLDFSPLIVLLVIYFLEFFLVDSLRDLGYRLRN